VNLEARLVGGDSWWWRNYTDKLPAVTALCENLIFIRSNVRASEFWEAGESCVQQNDTAWLAVTKLAQMTCSLCNGEVGE